MAVSRKSEIPLSSIKINGTTLEQVHQFKYLGTIITSDGRCQTEVKGRIAKTTFQKMKHIMTNKSLSFETRKRVLKCYVEPVLLYGCEARTLNKQLEKSIEATEMWFLIRMRKTQWTEKRTNEDILREAAHTRQLLNNIYKRQAKFIGHVLRKRKDRTPHNNRKTGWTQKQRQTAR